MATVAPGTLGLLKRILGISEFQGLRLVGGTALALLLGHRKSVDLDFFGAWDKQLDLEKLLSRCGSVEVKSKSTHGNLQFFKVDGVKVGIVNLPFEWLDAPIEMDGVRTASLRDIAAMKLHAITNRGFKRDFVDLAFLLDHFTLADMLDFHKSKYPGGISPFFVIRSLTYFNDAEDDDMPKMLVPFTWLKTKKRIQEAVRKLTTSQP